MITGVTTSPVDMKARQAMDIRPGDTIRVWQKIEEKGKTRLQAFEGLVLARKHGKEAGGTFTVRRVASGVGVEKVYPLYSPMIDSVEILKRAAVRRAKLYFIRDKVAREARRLLRRSYVMRAENSATPTEDVPVVVDDEVIAAPEINETEEVAVEPETTATE
ncbi:MAG: ribosomal protein large subunit ribosomal protein [Candidatus Kaiserbacteria bacterium]|nr:ribosomal protein large subunit ribosomal protein [Candidatus Kaiserbacteria bacterium]